MEPKTIFLAVFDNLSKFFFLVIVHEFSRYHAEKYKSHLCFLTGIGIALLISLLAYNGYSEYPKDFEYSIIIFLTILIPSWYGIYKGTRVKEVTLDRLVHTRRFFPEYRLLSDQEIVSIFREQFPKLTELSDDSIIAELEAKYSAAPTDADDTNNLTLLPNTRSNFPEYKNLSDKQIISVFKVKYPELAETLDIGVIVNIEKRFSQ
ncbi:hypothetical protein JXJ21_13290 [candidate division KSB1 bacterium]|nr:hypothetical protein [candidate division KSB1 bacterium]